MSEAESKREREIADRARELFAQSVAGLDGHTRSQLSRARAAAVAAAGERRPAPWFALRVDAIWPPLRLLPAGAAAALIALAALWLAPEPPAAPAAAVVLNDLDLLLEGENLDFFEELEFYAWLLEQPELLEAEAGVDDSG
jgi:hypothetical protein